MDCILFRHGIAVDREDWDGREAERPLTPKGVKKTREAAAGLRELDMQPTHLFSSPYTRALETATLIREELPKQIDVEVHEEFLPTAPPEKLLALLAKLPENACVICVGHDPHLSETAGLLVFGKATAGLSLKKAGACCIHFDGKPKAGQGQLQWWMTPSQLRSLAKQ